MRRLDQKTVAMAALAVAITAFTGVLGVVFAQTQQVERVAAAASDQAQASNAFRLIESMDSRAEGALITVAAFNAGLTGEQERADAINAVVQVQNALAASPNPLFEGRLAGALSILVDLLESGDTTTARRYLDGEVDAAAGAVRERATATAQRAATTIEVETGVAGNWGLVTSFGVGLIAPLLALGTFRSFVNRRRQQEALEQELTRSKELGQAKDDMIANLSHELRSPLTGLYGFALALEDIGFDDPEMVAEMNGYIIRDAADLSRMVDDLLVAAKAANDGLNYSLEDISIERELDEALVPFKRGDKIMVKDVQDARVFADRLRVRQIIRNIISNADKHGGPNVTIRGGPSGDRYRLDVIDDGPGVTTAISSRLFERFVHEGDSALTKNSVGVGLSVAQALAIGMDCRVEHTQQPGETIFSIDIPLSAREVATNMDNPTDPTNPVAELDSPAPSRAATPGPVRSGIRRFKRGVKAPALRPGRVAALLGEPSPADPFANTSR